MKPREIPQATDRASAIAWARALEIFGGAEAVAVLPIPMVAAAKAIRNTWLRMTKFLLRTGTSGFSESWLSALLTRIYELPT